MQVEHFAQALISTNCFSMIKKTMHECKMTDVQAKAMIFLLSPVFKNQLIKLGKTNPVRDKHQEIAATTWVWADDMTRDLIAEVLENALQLQILQFSTISVQRVEGFFILNTKNVKLLQKFLTDVITSTAFIAILSKMFKNIQDKIRLFSTEELSHEMECIQKILTSEDNVKKIEQDQIGNEKREAQNEALENQIKLLLGVINGSPDLFFFDTMFSSSMLASLDRIINAPSTQYGSLYSQANVLFYKMYSLLQSRRQDDNSVLLLTGLAYQPSNFVQLQRKNESLTQEKERLENELHKLKIEVDAAKMSLQSQNSKRINTAIVCQSLYLTNEMQKKNLDRVLFTLGLKQVPFSTTPETDFKFDNLTHSNDFMKLQFLLVDKPS